MLEDALKPYLDLLLRCIGVIKSLLFSFAVFKNFLVLTFFTQQKVHASVRCLSWVQVGGN